MMKLKDQLAQEIAEITTGLAKGRRYMLGICGPPGAGKSTLAQRLADEVKRLIGEKHVCVVPMDGFHMRNARLHELKLHHLKGVPATFDAPAFITLLKKLRKEPAVAVGCPAFDRSIEEPVEEAIKVTPEHKLLIIEGNYLLLEDAPWNQIKSLLDQVWYLDVPQNILEPRLIERHEAGGRDRQGAVSKMEGTDLPNARLIEASRANADRVLKPDAEGFFF